MVLTDLKKGDIFKFGDKGWDDLYRLHSVELIDNRYLISFIGVRYAGNIQTCNANSFTWRDTNIQVYIPKFYLSEQRRTKGIPCIPVSNMRHLFPDNLNPINKSDIYCSHDKYWYDYVSIS